MKKLLGGPAAAGAGAIDTLVGSQTEVLGDLRFTGGLHVDGRVRGNVVALGPGPGSLSISESGTIEGAVDVASIVLQGSITGQVRASDRLTLSAKARVVGDVYYRVLQMEAGAMVTGHLVHLGEEQPDGPRALAPPEPTASALLEKRRLKPI